LVGNINVPTTVVVGDVDKVENELGCDANSRAALAEPNSSSCRASVICTFGSAGRTCGRHRNGDHEDAIARRTRFSFQLFQELDMISDIKVPVAALPVKPKSSRGSSVLLVDPTSDLSGVVD
jgi:hypothetical protein